MEERTFQNDGELSRWEYALGDGIEGIRRLKVKLKKIVSYPYGNEIRKQGCDYLVCTKPRFQVSGSTGPQAAEQKAYDHAKKNVKYRWMALSTLLLTVLYVLIIGIIHLEPVYRIISFTVLGLVLVVASLFYTMMHSRRGNK